MFRTSDIILIGVMVAAAAMTYTIKRDAGEQLAMVRKLQVQIRLEEDTIDLLKADWSLLTQPARLQKLVERYQEQLGLEPVDPHQFARIDSLPERPLTIEAITAADAAGQLIDQMWTGAVE
ncbi:hypothetical protein ACFPLB_16200 [Aquamicrobium segne]|uniref:Secreted (Periplasmic) protein n=1 Tax=Aquamicrobium segne TaxID=469547 RepID=A0ABW0H0N1_9HYPH